MLVFVSVASIVISVALPLVKVILVPSFKLTKESSVPDVEVKLIETLVPTLAPAFKSYVSSVLVV